MIVLHIEEAAIIYFKNQGVPIWQQLIVLPVFNVILIAIEVLIFRQLRRILIIIKRKGPKKAKAFLNKTVNTKKTNKIKIPKFILVILNGKPFNPWHLFFFGFLPEFQKFGSFIFAMQIEKFGWKGFWILCLGGTCRLVLTILLPIEVAWFIIVTALSIRFSIYLFQLFQRTTKNTKQVLNKKQK